MECPLPSPHILFALIKLSFAIIAVVNPLAIRIWNEVNFCGRRADVDRPTHHPHLHAGAIH